MTTTTIASLTDFLLARIAEDEAVARRVAAVGSCEPAYRPARVLAECAAKRAIVESLASREDVGHPADVTADYYHHGLVSAFDGNLRTLAAVYADHPDYQESWRP